MFAMLMGIPLAMILANTAFGEYSLGQRRKAYQESLDMGTFRFKDDEANARYSKKQCDAKWQIRIIESHPSEKVTFKLARNDKEILALEGHLQSVFLIENNTLFFAHFLPTKTGCLIAAYDLDSSKNIWRTELEGIGKVSHEQYSNKVNIYLSRRDCMEDGAVFIAGKETYGNYVEVLDRKTGKQLAHRIYKRGLKDS